MRKLVPVLFLGPFLFTPSTHEVVTASGLEMSCAVTPIHYTAHHGALGVPNGIPWFAAAPKSAHIIGFLFFIPHGAVGQKALMRTNGNGPNGRSDKILWYVSRGETTSRLTITGTNLSSASSMRTRAIDSSGAYPSILDMPTPGCWSLTVSNGKVKGHVTVEVLP
jgi:hypothetical protein